MTNLDGKFTVLTETGILDKETGIEKFPINTNEPLTSGEVVDLTVDGKSRKAVIWQRARKSYNASYLPEIQVGENITWLHLLPEQKAHKFIVATQPAI